MILTVTTIVVLVIGILSLSLALYGGYIAAEMIELAKHPADDDTRSESLYYLLGMIGIIVLLGRIVTVPLFFWMLQSLVPYCPSAMCAYGVVNAGAPYSEVSLILKLFVPFAYGGWILLEISNRRHPLLPLLPTLARSFLLVLVPLVFVDSAADVILVATLRPVDVPCCSSVYDVNPPFSPSSILGPEVGMFILFLTVSLSLLLIVLQWAEPHWRRTRTLVLLLTLVVPFLYLIALHDTYAPLLLGLPNHHCPYCLFQEFPDTTLFTALFWIGVASSGWRILIETIWASRGLPSESVHPLGLSLIKLSSVTLLFSMVSMISHLLSLL